MAIRGKNSSPITRTQCPRSGCYPSSSLRQLPQAWRETAFNWAGEEYCLRAPFRESIQFQQQDIRLSQPGGAFQLILCRNLVFTYFEAAVQQQVLAGFIEQLAPGGVLVTGKTETLPEETSGLSPWFPHLGIYRREPG